MGRAEHLDQIRIYCAGPMGSDEDFACMRELSAALRQAGYSTFAPVDDGFPLLEIFRLMEEAGWPPERRAEARYYIMVAVFAFDLFNLLEGCQAVAANLAPFESCAVNPDSGTVTELSLAYAFGKPIVAYKRRDVRYFPVGSTLENGWDNPMVIGMLDNFHLGAGGYVAASYPELLQRLAAALAERPPPVRLEHMPEGIRRRLDLGRHIQEIMRGDGGGRLAPAARLRQSEEIASLIKGSRERFHVAPWNLHVPNAFSKPTPKERTR